MKDYIESTKSEFSYEIEDIIYEEAYNRELCTVYMKIGRENEALIHLEKGMCFR